MNNQQHTNKTMFRLFILFSGKNLVILFVSVFLICLWNSPAFAQKSTPIDYSCYVSKEARYKCFMQRHTGSMEHAKAEEARKRAIEEAQSALVAEKIDIHKARREKNRQEIMQQVQASRARNISHRGEKYSLTYGFVLEPRN